MSSVVDTIRDAIFGNPPSPGYKPSREVLVKAFLEMEALVISGAVSGADLDAIKAIVLPLVGTANAARDASEAVIIENRQIGSDVAANALLANLAATTALTATKLYSDVNAGLAQTNEGQYFSTVGDNTSTYAILYRKVNGAAIEQARYASKAAYEGAGGAGLIGMQIYGGVTRTVYAEAADAVINVRRYGLSVGAPGTIASDAIAAACKDGDERGKPVYFPSIGVEYFIDREQLYPTGIIGDGKDVTVIRVAESARAAFDTGGSAPGGRQAAIRIGRMDGEADRFGNMGFAASRVPVRGFTVAGLSIRTAKRTADRSSQQFNGVGLLYGSMASNIHAVDVGVRGFDKGIDHCNRVGHLGGTGITANANWHNLYWSTNADDYRYFDCDFTGANFSSYGFSGTGVNGLPGGISSLLLMGCHAGFSPYEFWGYDGAGITGIQRLTMIGSAAEQIGNGVMRLPRATSGQRLVTHTWNIENCFHSWTDPNGDRASYDAYTIENDPDHSIQLYAVDEVDLVQGGPLDMGGLLQAGTSGYVMKVNNTNEEIRDPRGPSLYLISSGVGNPWLTGSGLAWRQVIAIPRMDAAINFAFVLADITIPPKWDGYVHADFLAKLHIYNPDGVQQGQLKLAVNNGPEQIVSRMAIPAGHSELTVHHAFQLVRRDRAANVHRVVVSLGNLADCQVNGADQVEGAPSQAIFRLENMGGDVG